MIGSLISTHFTVGVVLAIMFCLFGIMPNADKMRKDDEYRSRMLWITFICFVAWEYLILRGLRRQL